MNTPEQVAHAARLAASVMYSRARSAGHHGAQGNEKGARRSTKEADKKTAELHRLIDELRAMAEARQGSGEPEAVPTPIQQQAAAWEMVFQTLCEVAPGWNHQSTEPGAVKAVQFIRELAAAAQVQPDTREQRLSAAMKRLNKEGPLPGMISAFEQQFGQTWTDREWRSETSVWACAWRAALSTQRQAEPVAWVDQEGERAITAKTKAKMLADGGACASSVLPYNIPAYTHPPSAQQATGSGQVLTEANAAHAKNLRRLADIGKDCGRLVSKDGRAWADMHAAADALAAATQAQPEGNQPTAFVSDLFPSLRQSFNAAGFEDSCRLTAAAPTTGKREPLAERVISAAIAWETGSVTSPLPGACIELRDAVIAYRNAHGITVEQR